MRFLRGLFSVAVLMLTLLQHRVDGFQSVKTQGAVTDESAPSVPVTTAPVWKLQAGDSFVVLSRLYRRTLIDFPDQPAAPLETEDRQQLRYTVDTISPTGDAVFIIEIEESRRQSVGQASRAWKAGAVDLQRLNGFRLWLQVDPEGRASLLPGDSYRSSLQKLAGGDDDYAEFLRVACPEELMVSWFERPFWLPRRNMIQAEMQERTVGVVENAGPFGLLRCDAVLRVQQEPESSEAEVQPSQPAAPSREPSTTATVSLQISGTPRFLPLPLSHGATTPAAKVNLPVTDIRITEANLTGLIKPSAIRSANARPPFESLLTNVSAKGTLKLAATSANAAAGTELSFELQQQRETRITSFIFAENRTERLLRVPVLPPEPQ